MGTTRFFGLAFFDFGDQLDSTLNVQKEIDRFVVIDKQLFGLYNVFGNGVVEGWTVSDNGFNQQIGISVLVSTGIGIINFLATQSSLPGFVNNIPANSIVDILAVVTGSTPRDRSVDFTAVQAGVTTNTSVVLARVTTGDNAVVSIDNTVRTLVGFESIIEDEINQHAHRGTPSKIDLKEETKNQLPGARIEGIDASQIVSGVFDVNRIPQLDHNDLENRGLLTHASLDTFVRNLSQNNLELMGEIASINLLKTIVFLKHLYPAVDEHFVNELTLIPGISPNDFIDFDNSTANINLVERCLSGVPVSVGTFSSIIFDDNIDFFNSVTRTNVFISNDTVTLQRKGTNVDVVEDFDHSIAPGDSIPGFDLEIIPTQQHIQVISDATDGNKIEGDFSGVFNATSSLRAVYTKVIDPVRTWTDLYDELVIWAKTNTQVHEAVFGYLVTLDGETEVVGTIFEILSKDEVTVNADEDRNNFKEFSFGIIDENVVNVSKLVIFTDEVNSSFTFTLDDIHVRRTNLVSPSGTIRFRHISQNNIIFHSVFYDATLPEGTGISVRIKVAGSEDLLPRSFYSFPLVSGNIVVLSGAAAEIEVNLTTNDQAVSPVLNRIELRLLADSDSRGFVLNSEEEWERGTLDNIDIDEVSGSADDLVIKAPVNVDGYSFATKDAVSEVDSEGVGLLGFSGNKMPISPVQALNWDIDPFKKFKMLRSTVRRFNKNFLIADTANDRVVEVDSAGTLIRGFGSTYSTSPTLFPLSSTYNKSTKVLSVVFTKKAIVQDITKFILTIGSVTTPLLSEDTVLPTQKGNSKILEIQLGSTNFLKLLNVTKDLFIDFQDGALSETIKMGDNSKKLSGLFGIKVFIGEFIYMDGIKHPVFVDYVKDNTWIVCNSSIIYNKPVAKGVTLVGSQEDISVAGLLEFNIDTLENVYSTQSVSFSDFTLGSVVEYQKNKLLVAGLREGRTIFSQITGQQLIDRLVDTGSTPSDSILFRAAALDSLTGQRGVVVIIDKVTNNVQNFYFAADGNYPSDIDVFSDGDILVSESGFAEVTGKIVTLDTFANVINIYGTGLLNVVNDAKSLINKGMLISV